MPRAAYCSECECYVWVGKDGGCAAGHPRADLRAEFEAAQDGTTGAPILPGEAELPVAGNAAEALSAIGRGVCAYAGAIGQRLETRANWASGDGATDRVNLIPGESPQPGRMSSLPDESLRSSIVGRSRISRSRRVVLIAAGCLLFLAVLVPPWLSGDFAQGGRQSVGYGFLFTPPARHYLNGYSQPAETIDLSRLALESLLILLAAGIALVALPQNSPRN